jgi:hypothetical protein
VRESCRAKEEIKQMRRERERREGKGAKKEKSAEEE